MRVLCSNQKSEFSESTTTFLAFLTGKVDICQIDKCFSVRKSWTWALVSPLHCCTVTSFLKCSSEIVKHLWFKITARKNRKLDLSLMRSIPCFYPWSSLPVLKPKAIIAGMYNQRSSSPIFLFIFSLIILMQTSVCILYAVLN